MNDNQKQNANCEVIEELKKIPNPRDYQDKPVKSRANWFNINLVLYLTILFICLGLIIIFAII